MNRISLAACLAACLAAGPVLAADPPAVALAIPCPDGMELDSIVEPWDQNSAVYANGDVRIALIDLVEPAVASYQLAVLHPPRDVLGARQCHLIARDQHTGFAAIDFGQRDVAYHPQTGLTIAMPFRLEPEGEWSLFTITVDQQTGKVSYSGRD